MHIILGASGQVGSLLVGHLHRAGQPVYAVVRNKEAREKFTHSGIRSGIADLSDRESLARVFEEGTTLFVLTPENPLSSNIFDDTRAALENVQQAVSKSPIKRIIGLSSFGAQHPSGTGNLTLSYLLEQAFKELPIEKTFIRPAYYYSNWLGFLDAVKQTGVLPTFFPADLKIPMIAPTDVALFISEVIINPSGQKNIIEIMGPDWYSASNIAAIFGKVLHKQVEVNTIPENEWENTFLQLGITKNYAQSLTEMTKAVIDKKATPANPDEVVVLKTDFEKYLQAKLAAKI